MRKGTQARNPMRSWRADQRLTERNILFRKSSELLHSEARRAGGNRTAFQPPHPSQGSFRTLCLDTYWKVSTIPVGPARFQISTATQGPCLECYPYSNNLPQNVLISSPFNVPHLDHFAQFTSVAFVPIYDTFYHFKYEKKIYFTRFSHYHMSFPTPINQIVVLSFLNVATLFLRFIFLRLPIASQGIKTLNNVIMQSYSIITCWVTCRERTKQSPLQLCYSLKWISKTIFTSFFSHSYKSWKYDIF